MMSEVVLPSNLVPIKDVNVEKVQNIGRFAVEMNNWIGGCPLIYKRVVNGMSSQIKVRLPRMLYIIVIEAINDDRISRSYIAKVDVFIFHELPHNLLSFEDVLKDFYEH